MMMMMMMSEFIVAQRFLAGLDEDALHSTPPVVLIGGAHAVHLPLSTYGVAVLLACHAQENVGAYVFEAHSLVALPVNAFALNRPHVQVVTLAVLSESTHLLVIRQRRAEVVCVEVSSSLHVCDPNGLATLDGSTAQTWIVGLPTNLPVAVGIICILHSSYRLLSTA